MMRRTQAIWICVLIVAGITLSWAGLTATGARQSAMDASARLTRVQAAAQEIDAIGARLPAWAIAPDANADSLAKRAGQVVAAAELPASSLASFTSQNEPAGQTGTGSVKLMRRRATLVLGGPTLPQLGNFLSTWKTKEPEWTVASIDISVDRAAQSNAFTAGGDLPLRTILTLESYTLASHTSPNARTPAGGAR